MAAAQQIIKGKLAVKDVLRILDQSVPVEKLMFSEGAWAWLPICARRALEKMGIEIETIRLQRGPKPKTDVGRIKELSYLPVKEISQRLGIPLRTVYYHLAKGRVAGR